MVIIGSNHFYSKFLFQTDMAGLNISNLQQLKDKYQANLHQIHSLEDYLHEVVDQLGWNHHLVGHIAQQIQTYQFINQVIRDFIDIVDGQ